MQLIFAEDIDRDVKNWRASWTAGSDFLVELLAKRLPEDIPPEKINDEKYLREYLDRKFYAAGTVTEFRKWLEANVNVAEIEKDLESLMRRTFLAETITAYITVFGLGRYHIKENIFYVIYRSPERDRRERITAIYHELMHFLFHWHYWDQCRASGLSDNDINNFKESFTVLLNPILEKRGLSQDRGYPAHKAIREQLTMLYKENQDFPIFFEKALAMYKDQLNSSDR